MHINQKRYRDDPAFRKLVSKAIDAHARANKSDPFASNRIRTHILNGIEEADEILADALTRLEHAR